MHNIINRHTFVYVDVDEYLPAFGSCDISQKYHDVIIEWFAGRQPAIIRMPCVDEVRETVYCGICLPLSEEKYKIPFELAIDSIERFDLPPLLSDCLEELEGERVLALKSFVDGSPVLARTVGSLAWQYLTHKQYMNESSDIDMVFYLDDYEQFSGLGLYLREWEDRLSYSVDIEIITPGGVGFLWKEYRRCPEKILVKYPQGPRLLRIEELWAEGR